MAKGHKPLTAELALSVASYVASSAFAGASNATIARAIGVSERSLVRHFGGDLAKKRAERQIALAAAQQKYALKGNATLLIFLGKQPEEKGGLGQVDEMAIARNLDLGKMMDEELQALESGKGKLSVVRGGAAGGSRAAGA